MNPSFLPAPDQLQPPAPPQHGFGAQFRAMAMPMSTPLIQQPSASLFSNKPNVIANQSYTKAPKTDQIPSPPAISCTGWDPSEARKGLPQLPNYFPKDMIKLELPVDQFGKTITNMQECIRSLSIQAEYCNSPVSAKLQTVDYIDMHLLFWKAQSEDVFFIDIQRRKGDFLDANRYVHKLLDAARGNPIQDDFQHDLPSSTAEIESLISKIKSSNPAPVPKNWMETQSMEETTSNALQMVYDSLVSTRLDMRKRGLEFLSSYTDLRHTLSSTAIPSALVVLVGKSPTPEEKDKCQKIQQTVLWVLRHGEFEGDSELYPSKNMQPDGEQLLRADEEGNGRPQYYVEYMKEVYHLALTILVNSLEVVACFHQKVAFEQEVKLFLDATDNNMMYRSLLGCVEKAERKLSDGYLACKALRLLAEAWPEICEEMKKDDKTIERAIAIGKERHALLATESEKLHNLLLR